MSLGHVNGPRYRQLRAGCFLTDGFSLLELAVVLLVVSILLAVAVPSYQRYALRMHRADAVRALLTASACQERRRAASGYYDTTHCAPGEVNPAYLFHFEPAGTVQALAYTIVAEPRTELESDPCASLLLDQSGQRSTSGDPSAVGACWGGR